MGFIYYILIQKWKDCEMFIIIFFNLSLTSHSIPNLTDDKSAVHDFLWTQIKSSINIIYIYNQFFAYMYIELLNQNKKGILISCVIQLMQNSIGIIIYYRVIYLYKFAHNDIFLLNVYFLQYLYYTSSLI